MLSLFCTLPVSIIWRRCILPSLLEGSIIHTFSKVFNPVFAEVGVWLLHCWDFRF